MSSGTWEVWHANGNLYRRFTCAQGKDSGPSTEWYDNAQPRASGEFTAGWKTGIWTFWDTVGHRTEVVFAQGIPLSELSEVQGRPCPPETHLVGPEEFGSEGGQSLPVYRCVLADGMPHGWGVVWDIRGHRSLELVYRNGEVVSRRSITN
jgi:antitoxin component YwqK of YwqJK toxin-antitoxin module